jgi:1,4-alpha-glucan branching enzyme
MLTKNYTKSGKRCRVTFKLAPEVQAKSAVLLGDFNQWKPNAEPMRRLKNGGFSTTVTLDVGKTYRFRYFLDDQRWENDWEADDYAPNTFGSEDSIVHV